MRLIYPVDIAFNQPILVAFVGLIVNGASVFILGHQHDHVHEEEHHHGDSANHEHVHTQHHRDHNLRAAYLHVMAEVLTSIFALLAGKYYGLIWMDPLMGIVGAMLVARWSAGLLHTTGAVLLDRQGPKFARDAIRESIEGHDDNRVADLHLWCIGPNIHAVELVIVTHEPQSPDDYKKMLPKHLGLVHVNAEVHQCAGEEFEDSASQRTAREAD